MILLCVAYDIAKDAKHSNYLQLLKEVLTSYTPIVPRVLVMAAFATSFLCLFDFKAVDFQLSKSFHSDTWLS